MKKVHKQFLRYGTLSLSLLFIITGLLKHEHIEVLRKAVNLCLECIGIG